MDYVNTLDFKRFAFQTLLVPRIYDAWLFSSMTLSNFITKLQIEISKLFSQYMIGTKNSISETITWYWSTIEAAVCRSS